MMGLRHSRIMNEFLPPCEDSLKISMNRLTDDGSVSTPSRVVWSALWA